MYQVFLDKLLLPVTPSSIETTINGRNSTIELINGQEVNILKSAGLTEISFEFMIPSQKYPFATLTGALFGSLGSLSSAAIATTILAYLEKKKQDKKPFQFIVARIGNGLTITNAYNTNLKVSLENYKILEDSNNGLDIMVSVQLKQFVPYTTKTYNSDGTVTKTRG